MSWEHSHFPEAFAVFLTTGADELPDPDAIFFTEGEAKEYIARARVKALSDDYDGDLYAADADDRTPGNYLHEAGYERVRNLYVPWWNSTGDPDTTPEPIPDHEIRDVVRRNAPEAGEDTLTSVERRLKEWHLAKYGDRPVDVLRTLAKLGEEYGELCRAVLRGHRAAGQELADMVFVLFHLARGLGLSLTDAINEKLPIVEQRLIDPNAGREVATT